MQRTTDEAEINALIDRQTAAWNRADAEGWGECFSDDATFVNIMGMPLTGRRHIADRHGAMFRTVFSGSSSRVLINGMTPVGEHIVIVRL